ncbi:30S ribosomal protein S7 [Candidatus Dojkabacteria bacterium]|nr:30S ribosomal protein S7 [Candidatus Dojkabacteria bacterium]
MRGKKAKRRELKPDNKYNSLVVTKFVNYLMKDGKRKRSAEIVYGAIDEAGKQLKMKPVEALEAALSNIKPKIEVKSRRVGGSNYQVPVPVSEDRQLTLALRWLIAASRISRGSNTFADTLARELVASTKKEGAAYKKKEDVEKMAEANRAFAHFQW